MSKGSDREDKIMAPLSILGCNGIDIDASIYNRIYEAVAVLPDSMARSLVDAIVKAIKDAD